MDYKITDEDKERIRLLQTVTKTGLKELDVAQLERLKELIEKKDYSHNKKAQKSKKKLLAKINVAIYEKEEGKQGI